MQSGFIRGETIQMYVEQKLIFCNFPLKIQNHINGIQHIGYKELLFKNMKSYYDKNNLVVSMPMTRFFPKTKREEK